MQQMMKTGHTETASGVIPHLLLDGGQLRAPVKLDMRRGAATYTVGGQYARAPLVREGHYVHALPGGGEILGGAVV